jgi:hypothetical protein
MSRLAVPTHWKLSANAGDTFTYEVRLAAAAVRAGRQDARPNDADAAAAELACKRTFLTGSRHNIHATDCSRCDAEVSKGAAISQQLPLMLSSYSHGH